MLPHYLGKILKFKFIKNDTNEPRKAYNIDINETFIVTRLNDMPLNIVTTFVQSVDPSPAHKHEDGNAARQCIVNDGLVDAVREVHQTLLEFASLATAAVTGARHGSRCCSPLLLDQRRSGP